MTDLSVICAKYYLIFVNSADLSAHVYVRLYSRLTASVRIEINKCAGGDIYGIYGCRTVSLHRGNFDLEYTILRLQIYKGIMSLIFNAIIEQKVKCVMFFLNIVTWRSLLSSCARSFGHPTIEYALKGSEYGG